MKKIEIKATRRPVTGKKVGALRREGKLPAVLYGHNFESVAVLLDQREASHILAPLTASQIVTIVLDGKEHAAIVREKQRNYIKNSLLHVDFQVVSLTEKIHARVAIQLEGVAPAVKDFNGVIVSGVDWVEVEALPQDLPERIIVDVSVLKNIGDAIFVRDLPIPADVTVMTHGEEMVANVTFVGEEKAEEGAGPIEPEVIEKGKKEEEEE